MYNYCGPYYSNGKIQRSVVGDKPALNPLDECCRIHDSRYATTNNTNLLNQADREFITCASQEGTLGKIFAGLVSTNQYWRGSSGRADENMPNLRSKKTKPTPKAKKLKKGPSSNVGLNTPIVRRADLMPPTNYSTPIALPPATRRTLADGCQIVSNFVVGKAINASNSATPELALLSYINPWMMGNAELQSLSQTYEEWRLTAMSLHFRGFQGTSVGGEFIIIVEENANTIVPATTKAFYQRALSGTNTLITPVWCPSSMNCKIDRRWKIVDTLNVDDLSDATAGCIYAFNDGHTAIPGYIIAEANFEFRGLKYNPHVLTLGSFYGGINTQTLTCSVNPVAGSPVNLTGTGFVIGDIYRVVMQPNAASWTAPTGTTASNLFTTAAGSNIEITSATQFFAVADSTTNLVLYNSYASANSAHSDTAGAVVYRTNGTSLGSFTRTFISIVEVGSQPSL